MEVWIAISQWVIIQIEAIVVGGATYYVATKVAEKLREKQYLYYHAIISRGTVYIGPAVKYEEALSVTIAGGDTFSIAPDLAKALAIKAGATYEGPECHGDEGSFMHYHPKYGVYSRYDHCFF